MATDYPSLDDIKATYAQIAPRVKRTPVWAWDSGVIAERFSAPSQIWLKLELFQATGTFKMRGATVNAMALSAEQLRRGVTAVSAGNHAIAVAHAARQAGTHARVVMFHSSSPARVGAAKALGAEVVIVANAHEGFALVDRIKEEEGRTFIHPFEGELTVRGTATLGLELCEQVEDLDAVVVPIGGGGLCAGVSAAVKQINPRCKVYGVEPFGADSMWRSFQAGSPQSIEKVATIADSLGAPYALPYSFGVCRKFVDDIVRVDDDALCEAMFYLFRDAKLSAEPACAAATAAALGPLKSALDGKRVALIACGSNIDAPKFSELLARGEAVASKRA